MMLILSGFSMSAFGASNPQVLGCIPLTLTEYQDPNYSNCTAVKADACRDGEQIPFVLESGTNDEVAGFYDQKGTKCAGIAAASVQCPFQVKTFVVPRCEDRCGIPTNPLKCKKVDRFEFNVAIEQVISVPGRANTTPMITGTGQIQPIYIRDIEALLP
jgi:hypothetical protein